MKTPMGTVDRLLRGFTIGAALPVVGFLLGASTIPGLPGHAQQAAAAITAEEVKRVLATRAGTSAEAAATAGGANHLSVTGKCYGEDQK